MKFPVGRFIANVKDRPWMLFFFVLALKLASELTGRYGENCYLKGDALIAATTTTLCVAFSFPLARLAVVEKNTPARIAICLAAFLTTWLGCQHLHIQN